MSIAEYLLTQLGEECAEVQQRISKALRFGLHEHQPGQVQSNGERICFELNDVVALLDVLRERGVLDFQTDDGAIALKKVKVQKYLAYAARECGTVPVEELR